MSDTARLALRMLARDWRAGELRVLAAAIVIAVASITSVAFFGDRVAQALVRDAHQLLGADLVLVSDHPFQDGFAAEIARRGLQGASATTFISMSMAGEKAQLAGVKAVSDNYPLRGRLRIAPAPGAPDAPAKSGPPRGQVWIEERLVTALEAPVGTRIRLGRAELQVGAVLTLEPERSANVFNVAPRLIMNVADVPATVAAAVKQLAEAKGTTREAIALAWLLRHPAQVQPIVGTTNVERLRKSALADGVTLSREEWYGLWVAARGPMP